MLYLTKKSCEILAKEMLTASHGDQKFLLTNSNELYVALNCWCALFHDIVGEEAALQWALTLENKGVVACIEASNALADSYISNIGDKTCMLPTDNITTLLRYFLTLVKDDREILQLLRFCKRLSPVGLTDTLETTECAFWDLQRELRYFSSSCSHSRYSGATPGIVNYGRTSNRDSLTACLPSRLFERMKEVVSTILGPAPLLTDLGDDLIFGNGVSCAGIQTQAQKLGCYCASRVSFCPDGGVGSYQYPTGAKIDRNPSHTQEVQIVPKNYKKGRVIAPQPVMQQIDAYRVDRYVRNRIDNGVVMPQGNLVPIGVQTHHAIPLRKQEAQRELSRLGSISHDLATIDASSASDRQTWRLYSEIFPQDWCRLISQCTDVYAVDTVGKTRRLSSAMLSGNALTFSLESVVHFAIVFVAAEYASLFLDEPCRLTIGVYGDDVIINRAFAETVMDFYALCGLKANNEKTFFGDSDYLESCGAEWVLGYDVHTSYFPRSHISVSLTKGGRVDPAKTEARDIAKLVMLQHHLYHYPHANTFLTYDLGLAAFLTMSTFGSDCSDLWGPIDLPEVKPLAQRYRDCALSDVPESARYRDQHSCFVALRKGRAQGEPVTLTEVTDRRLSRQPSYIKKGVKAQLVTAEQYEMYLYTEFLKHGPRYGSELDRILGVSLPRVPYQVFITEPTYELVRQ